jgi:hypothetical protein
MNTTIPVEHIQLVTSCVIYLALIPLFIIPPRRKNPARFIFSNLEQFMSAQRITPSEFSKHGNFMDRANQKYLRFEYSLELSNFRDVIEELLRDHDYEISSSLLFDHMYSVQTRRGDLHFRIEVIQGSHIPNSFRVAIIRLCLP